MRAYTRIKKALNGPKLTAQVRRAELLLRNTLFLKYLETVKAEALGEIENIDEHIERAKRKKAVKAKCVSKQGARLKNLSPEDKRLLSDDLLPSLDFFLAQRKRTELINKANWEGFCGDRGIDPRWDGSLETLAKWTIGTAAVFFQSRKGMAGVLFLGDPRLMVRQYDLGPASRPMGPEETLERMTRTQGWRPFVEIALSPSTEISDIERTWPRIKQLKKEIWGFSEARLITFERDICFWDLRKPEFGKRPFQVIADRWNAVQPKKRVSRIIVDQAVKRIQGFIDRIEEEYAEVCDSH